MTDGVSNEPVIASTPTPISVEPRVAAPAEVVAPEVKDAPKSAEPVKTEEKAKPLSTREAIRAAAAKVNAEPTVKVEAVAEKASPIKNDPQPRAEDGKFTAKDAEPVSKADAQVAKVDEAKSKADSSSAKAPASVDTAKAAEPAPVAKAPALPSHTAEAPPARFSAAAKEKWAEAPDEVRAEVTRAVTELTKGFEKHRAAAERDSALAEFHDMAAKSQKNLRDVVASYVGMENQLRADPVKGFELICQNAGISFRDIATKYLGQPADQVASQQDAKVASLEAKIARLEQGLGGIEQDRNQAKTQTTTEAVTKFAAENPRFEELSDDIAFFLKSGRTKDLAEAYKLAERLNPAPAAPAQAATPEPASSAAPVRSTPTLVVPAAAPSSDAGTKSIAGTPTAGSDPVRKQPSNSIKEAIRRAQAAAG